MEKKSRIWVRPFNLNDKLDTENVIKWNTTVDLESTYYPLSDIVVAHDETEQVYVPLQISPVVMGTIDNPGVEPFKRLVALKEALAIIQYEAQKAGSGEVFLISNDEGTNAFANKAGFEEVVGKVYRIKLNKLGK